MPDPASNVFAALADAPRRDILSALLDGERSVGSLVDVLSISQPQVSKHLRVLREAQLVRCRAQGRRRLYRLEPESLRSLRDWLTQYERAMIERFDRMDDYLRVLQQPQGEK
ncbi:MAG TPA: metalloregulator ArsR/SmtB family transcription factor [Acidimicrobiales bacterium]|jgi:DNA-binding transcriptional ArsR family regulator